MSDSQVFTALQNIIEMKYSGNSKADEGQFQGNLTEADVREQLDRWFSANRTSLSLRGRSRYAYSWQEDYIAGRSSEPRRENCRQQAESNCFTTPESMLQRIGGAPKFSESRRPLVKQGSKEGI